MPCLRRALQDLLKLIATVLKINTPVKEQEDGTGQQGVYQLTIYKACMLLPMAAQRNIMQSTTRR